MLRVLVALLLGANLLYAAYQWGWLAMLGWGEPPVAQSQTPAGEVAPERIVIVPPTGPSHAATDTQAAAEAEGANASSTVPETVSENTTPPAPPPPAVVRVCRAVDGLTAEAHQQLQTTLTSQLQDSSRWVSTEALVNGRWIVYIGKLSDAQLQTRRAQLKAANIEHRVVTTPRLSPGLALGTYSSPDRARNALETIRAQGVRDARVEQERAPVKGFSLQINELTPDELKALEASEALKGKILQPCP